MRRHGLTLLETLLALVLLLALGAIVLPAMMETLHERAFESAADVTNEQLMLARAHAQATGAAVEVTYNAGAQQVQARLFAPWLNDGVMARLEPGTSPLAHAPALAAFGEMSRAGSQPGPITESWATRPLSDGMRIVAKLPPAARTDSAEAPDEPAEVDGFDAGMLSSADELWPVEDVRLAVFMPDGSALLGEPVWLGDEDGRWGMISINPWSGLPFFQRLSELTAGVKEAQPDAGDEASPAPGAVPDEDAETRGD